MGYNEEKARKMYNLYVQGKPCKKAYAAVEKDDKYVVLKNAEGRKSKYSIAGGTVEENEINSEAIVREVYEELNMNVEVVKSLGFINWTQTWTYQDKTFEMPYEVEVFLTKFISHVNKDKLGLDGEFDNSNISVVEISKEEMLNNVYEFVVKGITF